MHSGPGQIQQLTPWCELHVPLRFCEQLKVPSLHRAVAVPQVAANGLATVQIFDPGAGVGAGGGLGLGDGLGTGAGAGAAVARASAKSTCVADDTVAGLLAVW